MTKEETKMSNTNTEADAATTKLQQEVYEKINRKIRLLQEEFEEVLLLRHVANEVRRFRKQLTNRYD
jgi:hypothetical protein